MLVVIMIMIGFLTPIIAFQIFRMWQRKHSANGANNDSNDSVAPSSRHGQPHYLYSNSDYFTPNASYPVTMGRPRVRRNSTVITEPLPKYPSEDDIFPGQVGPNDTRNPDAPILPDRAMSATPTSSFETADGQRSRHTTSPPESPPPPPIEPDELPPAYEEVEGARNVPVLVENAPEARQEAGVVVEDATQRSS